MARAKYFGSKLALKEEWVCVDPPYFAAPGEREQAFVWPQLLPHRSRDPRGPGRALAVAKHLVRTAQYVLKDKVSQGWGRRVGVLDSGSWLPTICRVLRGFGTGALVLPPGTGTSGMSGLMFLYFARAGTMAAPLTLAEAELSPVLPSVTMVFCCVEGGR